MVTREPSASRLTPRRFVIAAVFALAVVCLSTWLVWSQARADSSKKLDAQLAAVGAEVKKQFSTKENGEQIASWAALKFVDGLRGMLNEPLSDQQFSDVIASLSADKVLIGYDLAFKPDPTELEIEYARLFWTDAVRLYLLRDPLSASDKELIKAQIDTIMESAKTIALAHADDKQRELIPGAVESGRSLLYRDLNDPLVPWLKRPLTKAELEKITAWLEKEIPGVMAFPDDTPYEAGDKLIMAMPLLWRQVFSTYYQRPSLSPENMKLMREERREMNRVRWDKGRLPSSGSQD